MAINEKEFTEAYEMWQDFTNEVLYNNRFFISHRVIEIIKSFTERSTKEVTAGQSLYRARLFDMDEAFFRYYHKLKSDRNDESPFNGYDAEGSFVPKNNDFVSDGRANPAFIKYLYTAEDAYTALVEIRPYLNSLVSVSKIQVNENLRVADFTYDGFSKTNGIEEHLFYFIMSDFSKPSNSNRKDYIPTQYIAEYVKNLGFDGIRFNSSLHGRGRNVTIFNYDKCEAVDSKVYKINDLCFEAKAVAPEQGTDLVHFKLQEYLEKSREELLKSLFNSLNSKKD
ncbi:RES family NAD+ phosphorylase [Marinicrinis sediminis]|uniref:RES family NAD+ phosphorylase n=1 Tax=Marinicrinis sediminis TaxID=1652465 RepID=A0ABW5R5R0_9BACL